MAKDRQNKFSDSDGSIDIARRSGVPTKRRKTAEQGSGVKPMSSVQSQSMTFLHKPEGTAGDNQDVSSSQWGNTDRKGAYR